MQGLKREALKNSAHMLTVAFCTACSKNKTPVNTKNHLLSLHLKETSGDTPGNVSQALR